MLNHARFSVCLGGTSIGCDVSGGGDKQPGARIQEPGGLGRIGERANGRIGDILSASAAP
jgi:hypothetical protein